MRSDMSWQDACDAKVDDVRMRLLAAVVHSAKHSSSLSSVHLHSESACGADIQLCTNQLCSESGPGCFLHGSQVTSSPV